MSANWIRVLIVSGLALTGCQSGMLPMTSKAPAGVAGVDAGPAPAATASVADKTPAAASKTSPASKTAASTPRIEPGDFAEGYTQPKGSPIPPRVPPGTAMQPTSAIRR